MSERLPSLTVSPRTAARPSGWPAAVWGCLWVLSGWCGGAANAQRDAAAPDSGGDCRAQLTELRDQIRQLVPGDPRKADLQYRLANAYRDCGEALPAELAYRRHLTLAGQQHGAAHPELVRPLLDMAAFYVDQIQPKDAERVIARVEEVGISPESQPLEFVDYLFIRGLVAFSKDAYPEAERRFQEAAAILRKLPGDRSASIANAHAYLALVSSSTGRPREAIGHVRQGLSLLQGSDTTADYAHARALINLASVHHVLPRPADAEALLRHAIEIAISGVWVPRPIQASLLEDHAGLLRKLKRKQEAREAETLMKALRADPGGDLMGKHSVTYSDLLRSRRP
jgi:tetratricopeptide (TPR) repeat protein